MNLSLLKEGKKGVTTIKKYIFLKTANQKI